MEPHFLKVPSSPEEWLAVANKLKQKWHYPNCIGAIEGKYIIMEPPPNAGSYFYNYKHSHSVVLMAVAGPDYQCLYADVGNKELYFPAGLTDTESEDGKLLPGLWRQDSGSVSFLPPQVPSTGHNATTEAKRIREGFSDYFVNEGALEWQWERCN